MAGRYFGVIAAIKSVIPTPIKAAIRRLIGPAPAPPPPPAEPQDKLEWEFDWQCRMWLSMWQQPAVQAKCLDYWRQHRFLDEILRQAPISKTSAVLDVGCGLSSVLHYLPGRRIALDPLAHRYASVYRYPQGIVPLTAAGERLPFRDASFDRVFSSNCIDHTEDPDRMLAEISRVMVPDGRCALTCEVFATDQGVRNPGHPHSMTLEQLLALVRPFRVLGHWDSPWYGLRKYALGEDPTEQREHIFLLAKP